MLPLAAGSLLALSLSVSPAAAPAAKQAPSALADDPRVTDAIAAWKEWVEYQAAIDGVPGVSVGVVHDQELLATDAFGLANPATGAPARPDTLYSICSISKLFTSIAVLQERDAGRVRLDDPVKKYLPWFDIQDVYPDGERISVRGLLTHSAGLPRESDYPYWTAEGYPFPTHDQIVARLGEQRTLYPASRYFQYSNLGLTLAGEIVASVSGQPFGAYVRTHILDPLGMKDTFTEVPEELRGDRLAIGYSARKRDGSREVIPPFQTRGIAPAAGFASNVPDLARFAMWQFRLLSTGGDEVLRGATLREMQRVQWVDPDWKTTWGLGFAVSHEKDRTFVGHGGLCPGYRTQVRLEPRTKIGVIVLTNAIGAEAELYAAKAFDLIGPAIEKALEHPDDVPKRDPTLDRYTGVYDSIWGQSAIVRWEDGLAAVDLDEREPKEALVRLKKTGEHVFRRVREDDKDQLGEEFVFEVAEDGSVTRYKQHSNWYRKVR
jgi:CubicO group peptidase (beta-lactamase class C family)